MKKLSILLLGCLISLSLGSIAWAQSQSVTLTASVPSQTDFTLDITKYNPDGSIAQQHVSNMAFGSLTYDTTYNIFRANYYFSIDVGVVDNTSSSWTINHTRTDFVNTTDSSAKLNDHINVDFMAKKDATESKLQEVSYADSNNIAITKSQIQSAVSGGWLRIYYGFATGDASDNSGVSPVPSDQKAGNYQGQITISLTTS